MEHDAGIDVSLKRSSVCVVDGGEIVVEAKVTSEPEALVAWLRGQPFELARIGPVAAYGPRPFQGSISGSAGRRWKRGRGRDGGSPACGTPASPPNSRRPGTCAPRSRRSRPC